MNLKRRKAFYGDWWDEAAKWRTRRLRPAVRRRARQPDHRGARRAGVKGTLFVNEILTVRPGTQLEFLAAVVEERVPLHARVRPRAHRDLRSALNQHEVVMVWATDIPVQVRLRQNRDTTLGLCDEGEVDERTRRAGRGGRPST